MSLARVAVPAMAEPPEGVSVTALLTVSGSIGALKWTITSAFSGTEVALLAGEMGPPSAASYPLPAPVVKYQLTPFR